LREIERERKREEELCSESLLDLVKTALGGLSFSAAYDSKEREIL